MITKENQMQSLTDLLNQKNFNKSTENTAKLPEFLTKRSFIEEFITEEYKIAVMAKNGTLENPSIVKAKVSKIVDWLFALRTRPWCRISGYVGNGKSTMLQAVKNWYDKTHGRKRWTIYTANELCKMAANMPEKFEIVINYPMLMVDDLGTEPNEIVVFGNKIQPLRDMFYHRYDKSLITLFTTNLSEQAFSEYYGERIADRCREKQVKIVFAEKSYRK